MLWLLEPDLFSPGDHPLTHAARAAGHTVMRWDDDLLHALRASPEECVLFHGSLGLAHKIASRGCWSPGAFCNTEAFSCSAWYASASRWRLNTQYVVSTVQRFVEAPDRETASLALAGSKVFVRPDSALKPFSGRVVSLTGITAAALDHGFYYDNMDLPVVLSPYQELGQEWRFVVVGTRVVAGSSYEAEGRQGRCTEIPPKVSEFAQEMVSSREWAPPDPAYILDVVETSGGLRLLELNPFSGADLYRCDLDKIVAALGSYRSSRGV